MNSCALVLSSSANCLRTLEQAFDSIKVVSEGCSTASEAVEKLIKQRYGALVLDFDIPGAAEVGRLAGAEQLRPKPILFAMIGPMTAVGSAFQSGANFALYKPLDPDQVVHAVRASRGFIKKERRQAPRATVQALAHLRAGEAWVPALVLNLSEQGVLIQAPFPLAAARRFPLRFQLPGTSQLIDTTGNLIWSNEHGKAGLFFSRMSPSSKRNLDVWLQKRGSKTKDAVRVLLEPQTRRRGLRVHA